MTIYANYPTGFSPVENRVGNPWNQQGHLYYIPATDTNQYGLGDVVYPNTGSDIDGVPVVTKITAPGSISQSTTPPLGVIIGIRVADPPGVSLQGPDLTLSVLQIPATKARGYYVYVVDDPDVVFELPTDTVIANSALVVNSTTNPTSLVCANKNASFTVNNPTGSSPFSGTVLNTGSIAITASLPLKILGLAVKPDNLLTNFQNGIPIRLRVMWNIHAWIGSAIGA